MPSEEGPLQKRRWWQNHTIQIEIAIVVVGVLVSLVGFSVTRVWNMEKRLDDVQEHGEDIRALKDRLGTLEVGGVGDIAYAQLSSARTQRHTEKAPVALEMELRDAVHGIDFDPREDATKVRIITDGAYFVMAAPQVGRVPGSAEKPGTLDFFLAINDKPIGNSNVTITLPRGDDSVKDVIISQGILLLDAGDEISVMMSSFDPKGSLGVESIQPKNEPLVPSIIFSMFRLGDKDSAPDAGSR